MTRQSLTMKRSPIALSLALLGWASLAPAALAQTAAPAAGDKAKDVQQLESVTVTAGKRVESQRNLAGTVSVLQGGALEARGAEDQEDVFKLVPGVQFNKGDPNRAVPTIRGVGTVTNANSLGVQQATTGFYVEDVPFTDPFSVVATPDLAPFDLERVEVLRGPQGALYGSASLGGAVRYLFNKPNPKASEFSILDSVSSVAHGGVGNSLYVMGNVPLGGTGGLRVVLFDRHDSGYIRNSGTGKDEANDLHQRGGRLIGAFKPTANSKLTFTVMSQKTDTGDSFGVSPDPDKLALNTPTATKRSNQVDFGNLQLEVDLGGTLLTSSTGFVAKQADDAQDLTRRAANIGALVAPGLPVFPAVVGTGLTRGRAISQEFRVASNGAGAFSYVAGLFYQRTTFDVKGAWLAPGGAALWGKLGATLLPGDAILNETDSAAISETAVFADAEYAFGSGWSVGLGGRSYRNTLGYDVLSVFLLDPSIAHVKQDDSGFTPKASLKYRFGDHMWYALATKGYRLGGVNGLTGVTYKSDQLWNYETGLRLSPSRDVRLDFSAFVIDWKDAQVNAIIAGPLPINGIANVGRAKITGLEAAASWRATPSWSFNAALAYTDANTTEAFTSSSGAVVASGTRLPGTAKWQSSLQANYDFDGPLGSAGRFNVTLSTLGDRTVRLEAPTVLPGYELLDLRVSFARDAWTLALFVNNAADRRGISSGQYTQGLGSPGYLDYFLVKPRTVGMSLRYDL